MLFGNEILFIYFKFVWNSYLHQVTNFR